MELLSEQVFTLQTQLVKLELKLQIHEAIDDIFRWAVNLHQTYNSVMVMDGWIWQVELASFNAIVTHYDKHVLKAAIVRIQNDVLRLLKNLPIHILSYIKQLLDTHGA